MATLPQKAEFTFDEIAERLIAAPFLNDITKDKVAYKT
jgi:hypothetical protein